jgi:hypothetical protein
MLASSVPCVTQLLQITWTAALCIKPGSDVLAVIPRMLTVAAAAAAAVLLLETGAHDDRNVAVMLMVLRLAEERGQHQVGTQA